MVGLKKECPEKLLKLLDGKVWFTSPFLAESIKLAKKHFVDGSEEALDAATPLRLPWCREHEPDLEIDSNLFDVL